MELVVVIVPLLIVGIIGIYVVEKLKHKYNQGKASYVGNGYSGERKNPFKGVMLFMNL